MHTFELCLYIYIGKAEKTIITGHVQYDRYILSMLTIDIVSDISFNINVESYVLTIRWDRLDETIPTNGHNIQFD